MGAWWSMKGVSLKRLLSVIGCQFTFFWKYLILGQQLYTIWLLFGPNGLHPRKIHTRAFASVDTPGWTFQYKDFHKKSDTCGHGVGSSKSAVSTHRLYKRKYFPTSVSTMEYGREIPRKQLQVKVLIFLSGDDRAEQYTRIYADSIYVLRFIIQTVRLIT